MQTHLNPFYLVRKILKILKKREKISESFPNVETVDCWLSTAAAYVQYVCMFTYVLVYWSMCYISIIVHICVLKGLVF